MILAADIGGTKIAAARITGDGDLDGAVLTTPTPADQGPQAILAALVGLLEQLGGTDVIGVGVSTAGVVDTTTGTITTATTSLRGWSGTPVAAVVSERIGLPVHVLNDGLAFGVGESVYGLGSRLRGTGGRVPSMLLVVVGTGIGGAIVVGDDPWLGARGVAGHVGHVPVPEADGLPCPCGRTGHVEAVGGGAGLLAAYHRGGGDRSVGSAREVLAAAQTPGEDQQVALTAVRRSATAVGRVAGGLANVLDPDLVVFAGGLTQAGPLWWEPARSAYRQTLLDALRGLPLEVSTGGVLTALRGVGRYSWRRITT